MSRELKFRVWSDEDKQYRTDCKLAYLFHSVTGLPATVFSDEGDMFVIEQYTGLKDKNGKDIYEGDIVKLYDKFRNGKCIGIYIVQFDELNGEYVFSPDNDLDNIEYGGFPIWARYKVIGNIHKNPELLGGKNE